MTEDPRSPDESMLNDEQREQLDQACDAFEREWQQHNRPQLDQHLQSADEPLRSVLLEELLKIEKHWRERNADVEQLRAHLIERYPSHRPKIEQLLGSASGRPSLTLTADSLGPFQQLEKIGDGGFGLVFRAWDTRHQRQVALKIPRFAHQLTGRELKEFLREAKAAGSLDHSGIARVWDSGTTAGVTFIAYQLIDGENLKVRMEDFNRRTPLEIAEFVKQLADAVHYAHKNGIIHRDIKPSNVLLTEEDQPVLTDFGLALAVGGDATRSLAARVGTLDYMSPEQATGAQEQIDKRTDIWSLGVVLYELLTGDLPFHGATELQLCNNICEARYKRPRVLRRGIPKDLEIVIERCLQKSPGDRLPSCGDLVEELSRVTAGRPIRSRRVSFVEHALRWCRRNPRAMATFAAILAATVFGAWSWGLRLAENQQNENVVQQLQLQLEVKNVERRALLADMMSKQPTELTLLEQDLVYLENMMLSTTSAEEQAFCAKVLIHNDWITPNRFPAGSEKREIAIRILRELLRKANDPGTQVATSSVVEALTAEN